MIFMDDYIVRCTPEEAGITSASVLNLLDMAQERDIRLHSLIVMRHGKTALELYWHPYSADEPQHLYSFSKSVTATAVGFAVEEGLLSLDDRLVSFFPRMMQDDCDDRIYSVTVEHLLTMSAGIELANEVTMLQQFNWVRWFLNTPFGSFPGEKFAYNSLDTYMLSAILRKATGEGLVDYLMPRLFEPLGIERPVWLTCPMGIECGGWGLHLRPRDMAKFTQLYLDRGMWNGKRIISEEWVERALGVRIDTTSDPKFFDRPDSRSGYGYCFWHGRDGSVRADGMYGQYGIILPEKDAVIVTTAASPDQMLVLDLLWDSVIPAIDSITENSETGEDHIELLDRASRLCVDRPTGIECADGLPETISGRTYYFAQNAQSLMPFLVKNLYKIPSLGIEWVKFDITDDELTFSWRESYCDNSVSLIINGGQTETVFYFGDTELRCIVRAVWSGRTTLTLDIRPINTPHDARITFAFDGGRVTLIYDEDPPFETSLKMFFDLMGAMRPVSGQLSKIAGGLIPSIVGEAVLKEE
ncbi:MAG: serine hydrolase [Ruminococcaceae bacterium]|nr:serine hydrolase [Oscillospiraceae bacterium]